MSLFEQTQQFLAWAQERKLSVRSVRVDSDGSGNPVGLAVDLDPPPAPPSKAEGGRTYHLGES